MDHLSLRQRSKETRQVLPEAVRGLKTRVVFGAITLMKFFFKGFSGFWHGCVCAFGLQGSEEFAFEKKKVL